MIYMTSGIEMETIFGDGSKPGGGVFDALVGAGKRLLTGESLFMTVFQNRAASGKARVAFAAPYAGKIIPLDLRAMGGELICQKDSFLCAARGVSSGSRSRRRSASACSAARASSWSACRATACRPRGRTVRQVGSGKEGPYRHGLLSRSCPAFSTTSSTSGRSRPRLSAARVSSRAHRTGQGWLQSLPFSRLAGRIMRVERNRKKILDRRPGNLLDGDG
jgi:uncharacterized protein (AIM24 family)